MNEELTKNTDFQLLILSNTYGILAYLSHGLANILFSIMCGLTLALFAFRIYKESMR